MRKELTMVDFESLAEHLLDAGAEPFGLLTHQALPTADLLRDRFGTQLAAIFSPEHGYFGSAAAGEKTADERHPDWDIPIYSLYGETRKPTISPAEVGGRGATLCLLCNMSYQYDTGFDWDPVKMEVAGKNEKGISIRRETYRNGWDVVV
jgi:hypothetical protein